MEDNNPLLYRSIVIENLLPNNLPNFSAAITGTKIAVLKKEVGMFNTSVLLLQMLTTFCASFNVSKNMKSAQLSDYTITLIEENCSGSAENPSFTLEDFALFFERAKRGVYGKPFDYLDATLIQEWLLQYKEERYNSIIREHEALKNMQPDQPKTKEEFEQYEKVTEFWKDLKEKIKSAHLNFEINTELRTIEEQKRLKEISENRAKSFWGKDWDRVKNKIENDKTEEVQRSRPATNGD